MSSRVSALSSTGSAAALQFRQQVGRLGDMERARGDEQDVVGLHRTVLCRDRGALDLSGNRSRCTPSRDTSPPTRQSHARVILSISSRKTMAVVLDRVWGSPPAQAAPVEQLVGFLGNQDNIVRLLHGHPARSWCGPPPILPKMSPMLMGTHLRARACREFSKSACRRPTPQLDSRFPCRSTRRPGASGGTPLSSKRWRSVRPAHRPRAPRRPARRGPGRPSASAPASARCRPPARSRTICSTSRPT